VSQRSAMSSTVACWWSHFLESCDSLLDGHVSGVDWAFRRPKWILRADRGVRMSGEVELPAPVQ
jgi:hypothetical protein